MTKRKQAGRGVSSKKGKQIRAQDGNEPRRSAADGNEPGKANELSQRFSYMDWLLQALATGLVLLAPLVPEGAAEQLNSWPSQIVWMLLAGILLARQLLQHDYRVWVGWIDLAVYAVVFWVCFSGLVAILSHSGHARATINASWVWCGFGFSYFVLRRLVSSEHFCRQMLLAMVAMAVGCSVAGFYQRYFVFPVAWQSYESKSEQEKQKVLQDGGVNNFQPGSREREMWENRLFASSPTSTFVLANSLAVFLSPWLIIVFAKCLDLFLHKSWSWAVFLSCLLALLAFALLLTKSRTAYLAVGIGMLCVLAAKLRRVSIQLFWGMMLAGLLMVGLIGVVGFATGAVDQEVITQSFQSLSYRFEYWQATWYLIQDEWLFGCGPGNFQNAYARYQLVEASETVSDPHNFLMEVWAISGTPGLVLLLLGGGAWCRRHLGNRQRSPDTIDSTQPSGESATKGSIRTKPETVESTGRRADDHFSSMIQAWVAFFLATTFACLLAIFQTGDAGLCFICGLVGIVVVSALVHLPQGEWGGQQLSIALLTYLIGLSASGGIGFPSVAITGLLLLALISRTGEESNLQTKHPMSNDGICLSGRYGQSFLLILLLTTLIGAWGMRNTVIDPIQSAQSKANLAEMELLNGDLDNASNRLDEAMQSDPYDGNYPFFQLQTLFGLLQRNPTESTLNRMEEMAAKSVAMRPRNSRVALETAKIFLSLHRQLESGSLQDAARSINRLETILWAAKKANEFLAIATERRPNDALHAAYRAFGYEQTGDLELAKNWAERAQSLDEQNPHADKALKNQPFRLVDFESGLNIEQWLRKIRNE